MILNVLGIIIGVVLLWLTFALAIYFFEQAIPILPKEKIAKRKNNIKCINCKYLIFTPYATCEMKYRKKGIIYPDDSCGKGKLRKWFKREK